MSIRDGSGDRPVRACASPAIEVVAASRTAVLGPRGAGKTALLRRLAGLAADRDGDGRPSGRTAGRPGSASVSATPPPLVLGRGVTVPPAGGCVAFLFQHPAADPRQSVFDHVAEAVQVADETFVEARVLSAAAVLRIEPLLDQPWGLLAPEERQCAALARVLASDAPLLVLDEPFGRLDGHTRRAVRDAVLSALAARAASDGSAVVLATDDPLDALQLGGRMLVLAPDGPLAAGDAAGLFLRPATLALARACEPVAFNAIAARAERQTIQIPAGPRFVLNAPLAAGEIPVTLGIRAGTLRLEGHAGDLRFDARVAAVEIRGADACLTVETRFGRLVARVPGLPQADIGQTVRLHVDPGAVYVFDAEGALLLLPERLQPTSEPARTGPEREPPDRAIRTAPVAVQRSAPPVAVH